MIGTLILTKDVDKSVLTQGFTIPQYMHEMIYNAIGTHLPHGKKTIIKILLNGHEYEVPLINQAFNQKKYPDHGDVLQIRYTEKSQFGQEIQRVFSASTSFLNDYYGQHPNARAPRIPKDRVEYFSLYATDIPGTLLMECIPMQEYKKEVSFLEPFNEYTIESILDQRDDTADLVAVTKITKIRRLSKGVGDSLKQFYGYRCQICGEKIGEKYASNLIHAHHIDYFSKSLNNNPDNIMILCPNHHGIVHDVQPKFNRKDKCYHYQNGLIEGLILNKHL